MSSYLVKAFLMPVVPSFCWFNALSGRRLEAWRHHKVMCAVCAEEYNRTHWSMRHCSWSVTACQELHAIVPNPPASVCLRPDTTLPSNHALLPRSTDWHDTAG